MLATNKSPADLVVSIGVPTFRDRDDLDWFEGAALTIDGFGPVLIMKHDNNPSGLTALYVDFGHDPFEAEERLIDYFSLLPVEVAWRLSA